MGNKILHEEFISRVYQRYGNTIEITSEYKGSNCNIDFIYKCKHGEVKHSTRASNLMRDKVVSCYCFKCSYPNRDKIYIGAVFNYWTVIILVLMKIFKMLSRQEKKPKKNILENGAIKIAEMK